MTVSATAKRLGWAGLLPFVAAPVAILGAGDRAPQVGSALAAYALAIVCFLAGAWWGIALLRRRPEILIASNVLVLVACVGFVLLGLGGSMLLLAVLLLAAVGVERWHPVFRPQPHYYVLMRLRLSVVASVSLLFSALLLR